MGRREPQVFQEAPDGKAMPRHNLKYGPSQCRGSLQSIFMDRTVALVDLVDRVGLAVPGRRDGTKCTTSWGFVRVVLVAVAMAVTVEVAEVADPEAMVEMEVPFHFTQPPKRCSHSLRGLPLIAAGERAVVVGLAGLVAREDQVALSVLTRKIVDPARGALFRTARQDSPAPPG